MNTYQASLEALTANVKDTYRKLKRDGVTGMSRRHLEPDPAYEAAHMTAHDLLQVIREKLHDLPAPDSGSVDWDCVRFVMEVNRYLLTVIDMIEKETTGYGS